MLFVVHAIDGKDAMPVRAKFYRAHACISTRQAGTMSIWLPRARSSPMTAAGSVFVIDAKDRAAADAFMRSDPYHVNGVWETVHIHGYNQKRGTPIRAG
jgi:hypothetical protein